VPSVFHSPIKMFSGWSAGLGMAAGWLAVAVMAVLSSTFVSSNSILSIIVGIDSWSRCRQMLAPNVQVFAMAGHFVFRYAGSEADFCFVAEHNYQGSTALRGDENGS
jgi:hypothetical protein